MSLIKDDDDKEDNDDTDFQLERKNKCIFDGFHDPLKVEKGSQGLQIDDDFQSKGNPNGVLMIFMSHAVSKRVSRAANMPFKR